MMMLMLLLMLKTSTVLTEYGLMVRITVVVTVVRDDNKTHLPGSHYTIFWHGTGHRSLSIKTPRLALPFCGLLPRVLPP